jgi:hypothetical protein
MANFGLGRMWKSAAMDHFKILSDQGWPTPTHTRATNTVLEGRMLPSPILDYLPASAYKNEEYALSSGPVSGPGFE